MKFLKFCALVIIFTTAYFWMLTSLGAFQSGRMFSKGFAWYAVFALPIICNALAFYAFERRISGGGFGLFIASIVFGFCIVYLVFLFPFGCVRFSGLATALCRS